MSADYVRPTFWEYEGVNAVLSSSPVSKEYYDFFQFNLLYGWGNQIFPRAVSMTSAQVHYYF